MEKGYDKEIALCYIDKTSHYHCKDSPCILPLDHDNLQNLLICTFHDKASQTVSPLGHCQTSLQENHAGNAPDNLQMRHQLLYLNSHNLNLDSFQVFRMKYHSVLQYN